ncbi:MFS transporter [Prauserella sp. ASG 168]|uniref:MFS transporter n=1 Tax=Prauserella cavernicola TaxID=2800127 RepID=A0A934V4H4_9PSEU|nr:MFS transporter [Prauserella cavernicola]
MLLGLDVTVLYLVLPSLVTDLDPSGTQTLWIMDAYGFLIAGFLITMGTLGDRIGRRRLLLIGAAAFGVASVIAAYSTSAELLIAARGLLGVAGATLMPSTLALIGTLFTVARERALAIGVWATMFALGMAAGPVVGGALLAHWWWGSAFLVAVPVVLVLLIAGPLVLPEYRAPTSHRIDLLSVALSLASILPLVYAVKHAATGDLDAWTGLALVVGGVAGVVFVRRQLALPSPLLDVRLFADRALSAALAVLLVGLMGVGGVMFLVTQYLQLVEGYSPMVAGIWMGPPALAMLVAAIAAPVLARRLPPGTVMAGTLAISLVGYGLLALVGPGSPVVVVAGFALVYLGLGAIAALGTDLVVGAAPPERAGSAAALSETVQELGIAVGVALLGSLTTVVYRAAMPGETTAAESLSAAVAERAPAPVLERASAAFTTGLNVSAVTAGGVIAVATVFCTLALRRVRPLDAEPDVARSG